MLSPMTGRLWPDVGLTGVLVAVAVYCAARLFVRRWQDPGAPRYADLTHMAMAVVMIAMPAGAASPLWGGAVLVGFAAAALWAAGRVAQDVVVGARVRSGRAGGALGHVNLAVASAAMLYLVAWPGTADPARSRGHHHLAVPSAPLLGVVLVVLLVGLAVASTGALAGSLAPAGPGGRTGGPAGPQVVVPAADTAHPRIGWPHRLTLCCHTAMAVAMATMTVAML